MNDTFDKTMPLFHQYNSEISNQECMMFLNEKLSQMRKLICEIYEVKHEITEKLYLGRYGYGCINYKPDALVEKTTRELNEIRMEVWQEVWETEIWKELEVLSIENNLLFLLEGNQYGYYSMRFWKGEWFNCSIWITPKKESSGGDYFIGIHHDGDDDTPNGEWPHGIQWLKKYRNLSLENNKNNPTIHIKDYVKYISREIKSTLSKLETIKQDQFCIEKSSYLRNTENLEKLVVEE